ncbi:MAG: HAMP domain-containing histidine kinase [Acidimicrobiales bacterium]|nr:HAMP domain-containing histidine kinase [Acidimicrobiales bacterium]
MAELGRPPSNRVPNPAAPGGEVPGGTRAVVTDDARPETVVDLEPHGMVARSMVRIVDRLPDWMGSIRFRLTALYSLLLFGLAAFTVAGVYAVLASRLSDERHFVSRDVTVVREVPGGFELTPTQLMTEYRSVEQLANERALSLLRTYSLSALGLLFLASLAIGWLVAGRVLAPIGRITAVARDIQATDLSRRIAMRGPPDELKELADTFDAMLSRLDEAFEGQQRFVQEASHELRNPLAVIRTNLDVALADPNPDPVELRRTAELVERTAARMSTLVDDLLLLAQLDEGRPMAATVVDLADVVIESADAASAMAPDRVVRVRVEDVVHVVGDHVRLRQVVDNLLGNVRTHTPPGTVCLVTVKRDGDDGLIVVADDGPGMGPHDAERAFRRFHRADVSRSRASGGAGFGLSIVNAIVTAHGGTVELRSDAGVGTTVTVRLPIDEEMS